MSVKNIGQGFSIREGVKIILQQNGAFSQRQIYKMGDQIYAQIGSQYIGIHSGGKTSKPNISWKHFVCDGSDIEKQFKPELRSWFVVEN